MEQATGSRRRCGAAVSITGSYRSGQTGQTVNLMAYAFAGSNPALPSNGKSGTGESGKRNWNLGELRRELIGSPLSAFSFGVCGCSSMVEQQPSKLNTRVRFPSPASGRVLDFRFRIKRGLSRRSSTERFSPIGNPKSRIQNGSAAVAQLVEHFLGKEEVKSSSLFSSFGR
jgi:hypothetical protein